MSILISSKHNSKFCNLESDLSTGRGQFGITYIYDNNDLAQISHIGPGESYWLDVPGDNPMSPNFANPQRQSRPRNLIFILYQNMTIKLPGIGNSDQECVVGHSVIIHVDLGSLSTAKLTIVNQLNNSPINNLPTPFQLSKGESIMLIAKGNELWTKAFSTIDVQAYGGWTQQFTYDQSLMVGDNPIIKLVDPYSLSMADGTDEGIQDLFIVRNYQDLIGEFRISRLSKSSGQDTLQSLFENVNYSVSSLGGVAESQCSQIRGIGRLGEGYTDVNASTTGLINHSDGTPSPDQYLTVKREYQKIPDFHRSWNHGIELRNGRLFSDQYGDNVPPKLSPSINISQFSGETDGVNSFNTLGYGPLAGGSDLGILKSSDTCGNDNKYIPGRLLLQGTETDPVGISQYIPVFAEFGESEIHWGAGISAAFGTVEVNCLQWDPADPTKCSTYKFSFSLTYCRSPVEVVRAIVSPYIVFNTLSGDSTGTSRTPQVQISSSGPTYRIKNNQNINSIHGKSDGLFLYHFVHRFTVMRTSV